jgi:hypothetical protein
MRPRSAISRRCWSRCVGAVSAGALGIAFERGGTLVPCFSTSHSPAPNSFNPVLSTNRCTGSVLGGVGNAGSVSARRLSVEWSGTARSRPSRWMMDPVCPFGLPQGQAEHGTQRQCGCDRQVRIVRLTASRGSRFSPPGRDRLVCEPDRQTAALAQRSIIVRPVRYPPPLLRDVVVAVGIGLEGHGGHPRSGWRRRHPCGTAPGICRPQGLRGNAIQTSDREDPSLGREDSLLPRPRRPPPDPCNKVRWSEQLS